MEQAPSTTLTPGPKNGVHFNVPIDRETKVVTVPGDPLLHKVRARRFGSLMKPYTVKKKKSVDELDSVHLSSFYLEVTEEAIAQEDRDDLGFVESVTLMMRSLDDTSDLPVIEVAWYDQPWDVDAAPQVLEFDVDSDTELLPYFKTGFQLYTDSIHLVPPDDVSLKGYILFMGEHVVL
jgi:hypothetical protein